MSSAKQTNPGEILHMLTDVAKGSSIGIAADTPDIFLVAAAKDGDHQAYAELCRRHSKQILRMILRITPDVADAEDTLQETLLKAYVRIGRFEGRSAFSSWLAQIAINSALMLLRKKRSQPVYIFESGSETDDSSCLSLRRPLTIPKNRTCTMSWEMNSSEQFDSCRQHFGL
jgi:RNA polymerase sigma-70 factor (ECF subfamily)